MIGEFPAQRASNAENVSIWWSHHVKLGHGWVIRSHRNLWDEITYPWHHVFPIFWHGLTHHWMNNADTQMGSTCRFPLKLMVVDFTSFWSAESDRLFYTVPWGPGHAHLSFAHACLNHPGCSNPSWWFDFRPWHAGLYSKSIKYIKLTCNATKMYLKPQNVVLTHWLYHQFFMCKLG